MNNHKDNAENPCTDRGSPLRPLLGAIWKIVTTSSRLNFKPHGSVLESRRGSLLASAEAQEDVVNQFTKLLQCGRELLLAEMPHPACRWRSRCRFNGAGSRRLRKRSERNGGRLRSRDTPGLTHSLDGRTTAQLILQFQDSPRPRARRCSRTDSSGRQKSSAPDSPSLYEPSELFTTRTVLGSSKKGEGSWRGCVLIPPRNRLDDIPQLMTHNCLWSGEVQCVAGHPSWLAMQ